MHSLLVYLVISAVNFTLCLTQIHLVKEIGATGENHYCQVSKDEPRYPHRYIHDVSSVSTHTCL